jgi:hypothetical protein
MKKYIHKIVNTRKHRGGGASDFATGFYSEPRIVVDMSKYTAQNDVIARPESNYIAGNNLVKLNDPFSVVAAPYPMTTVGGGKTRRQQSRNSKSKSKSKKNRKSKSKSKSKRGRGRGSKREIKRGGGASQWGQMFYSQDDVSQMSVTPHDAERLWIKGTEVAQDATLHAIDRGLGLPSFSNF